MISIQSIRRAAYGGLPLATRRLGSRKPKRGVSLLEALVAMAVMAFGILGVMGMQLTLRSNADMAKQRSQATRIAQEKLEQWRSFSVLASTPSHFAYADIVTPPADTVTPLDRSTTYQVTGQVTDHPGHKTLSVEVSWVDRNTETQKVSLASMVSEVHPEFAASMVVKSSGTPTANPLGRHRSIPMAARDFGDGHSGFKPPQGAGGTVAWLFNNESGLIDLCTTTVASNGDINSRSDLANCSGLNQPTTAYMLLAGYVRFATSLTQPNAYSVLFAFGPEFPVPELQVVQTAPAAFAQNVPCFRLDAALSSSDSSVYYCAVKVNRIAPMWSGSVQFLSFETSPNALLATSLAENRNNYFKVCRFQAVGSYTNQTVGLRNENYVVIRAGDNASSFFCQPSVSWTHQPVL
jgi:Tfp pilus assembly protein PilV